MVGIAPAKPGGTGDIAQRYAKRLSVTFQRSLELLGANPTVITEQ